MKKIKPIHRYLIPLILLLILFNFTGFSQTFEEYKKQQQKEQEKFRKDYNKKLKELKGEFDEYVKQQDKKFADYLKKQWDEFQVFKGEKPPERPKPVKIPKYEPEQIIPDKEPGEIQKLQAIIPKPVKPAQDIIRPLIQESIPADYYYDKDHFVFYGNEIQYEYDPDILECYINKLNNTSISNWFTIASKTNYNRLVNNMLSVKGKYALNDWAYFLLLEKAAGDIFPGNKNNSNILLWFMLLRSGYDAKFAYIDNQSTVLFPSLQDLYHANYMIIDGKKYYMREYLGMQPINTYKKDYPGASKIINFNIYNPINLSNKKAVKSIDISYNGKNYYFELAYNPDMITLYNDYPFADMEVYFDASLTAQAKESLSENFLPVLENMTETEAANFLLYFTQNAFEYQIDEAQFGDERFLFPEETIYYPYSDCEDRSAFYAYLVKEFLKLDIIGLEYPWHVATAVKFNDEITGDFVTFDGVNYVIADPTYINAPVGRSMPKYRNQKAKIIELNNFRNKYSIAQKNWRIANKAGGFRGGIKQDHVFDNEKNCYITGYFQGNANFSIKKLYSPSQNRHCFIAKFDKNNRLLWVKNLEGDGISTGISVTANNNSLFVTGTFKGNITCNGKKITSANDDIFVLKVLKNGKIKWINNACLNKNETGMFLEYVITFNDEGKHLKTDLFTKNSYESSEGIFLEDNDDVLIAGAFNNTTGLNTMKNSFAEISELNYIELLKNENDAFINSDVDKSIAGLFAVTSLIKNNGNTIPGRIAQEALDKYNPRFREECPAIYKNIGKVEFLKNKDGVINIKTNKRSGVNFDKIKVNNNAMIKITSLPSGDEKINVLSGISVGKLIVWYDLNYVKMFKKNGDLLFDYDTDHTHKLVNLRKDILE